jgi:hypothetical protein
MGSINRQAACPFKVSMAYGQTHAFLIFHRGIRQKPKEAPGLSLLKSSDRKLLPTGHRDFKRDSRTVPGRPTG